MRETFLAPSRLFAGFGETPPWFWPLALSTAVAILAAAAGPDEAYLRQVENPVNRRGAPVEITSEPAQIVRYGRILAAMSALVGHPTLVFAVAGLFFLLFGVLGRSERGFLPYLAVTTHAMLVPALGTLVYLALRWSTGDFDLQLSAAALTPDSGGGGSALRRFLSGIDLFSLWTLWVLAAGAAALDPRRGRGRAMAVLAGTYLTTAAVLAVMRA